MMVSLDDLTRELAGLDFLHAREVEREVREGTYHTGLASVVQLVARRGAADAALPGAKNPRLSSLESLPKALGVQVKDLL